MLLGHRYYDASVGRFLSSDPAQAGSNWYAYCDNNPLVGVDPTGLYRVPKYFHKEVGCTLIVTTIVNRYNNKTHKFIGTVYWKRQIYPNNEPGCGNSNGGATSHNGGSSGNVGKQVGIRVIGHALYDGLKWLVKKLVEDPTPEIP